MKRKLKIAVASILSLALILSVTACNSEGSGGTQDPERTTNAEYADLVDYLKDSGLDEQLDKDLKVEKKIRWLAWWPMDETQAAAELFKMVYGIPEAGDTSYGADADCIFDNMNVAYADRYEQLGKMVASGDSPDIFPFEINNFPYTAYKGLFQPIDDYINLDDPLWDERAKEAMKQFRWGGKDYCALVTLGLDQLMWYRRSVVAEAGMTEPLELYRAGNWTWDTFLEMCDTWQKTGEGKYAIDGWQVPDRLVITTGVPIIGIVDGKLQDNFYNADIERAMNNLIDVLYKENYRYPRHELNGWSINVAAWFTGDILFFGDLSTTYKDTFQAYIKRYKIDPSDIFCVPFPRDPNADKYYQTFKNDSYMLVGGSKNTDGFTAWTQCVIATVHDEQTAAISREQMKFNYQYTDELLDWFEELQFGDALTPVFEFKNGIGQDLVDGNTVYNPVDILTQIPYLNCIDEDGNPVTFTTLRAANEGRVRTRIDDLNASLG